MHGVFVCVISVTAGLLIETQVYIAHPFPVLLIFLVMQACFECFVAVTGKTVVTVGLSAGLPTPVSVDMYLTHLTSMSFNSVSFSLQTESQRILERNESTLILSRSCVMHDPISWEEGQAAAVFVSVLYTVW